MFSWEEGTMITTNERGLNFRGIGSFRPLNFTFSLSSSRILSSKYRWKSKGQIRIKIKNCFRFFIRNCKKHSQKVVFIIGQSMNSKGLLIRTKLVKKINILRLQILSGPKTKKKWKNIPSTIIRKPRITKDSSIHLEKLKPFSANWKKSCQNRATNRVVL
jgi:hypothetical protein